MLCVFNIEKRGGEQGRAKSVVKNKYRTKRVCRCDYMPMDEFVYGMEWD